MRKNKARKKGKTAKILLSCILAAALGGIVFAGISLVQRLQWKDPQEILQEYMACIASQEYGKMYQMISKEESGGITEEEFIERNANIYEGIEAENIKIQFSMSARWIPLRERFILRTVPALWRESPAMSLYGKTA